MANTVRDEVAVAIENSAPTKFVKHDGGVIGLCCMRHQGRTQNYYRRNNQPQTLLGVHTSYPFFFAHGLCS
jgi:hypothetical protein